MTYIILADYLVLFVKQVLKQVPGTCFTQGKGNVPRLPLPHNKKESQDCPATLFGKPMDRGIYSQTSSAEYGMLPQPGYGPPCFSFSPRSPPVISKYLPTRVFSTMAQELPHTESGSPFMKR